MKSLHAIFAVWQDASQNSRYVRLISSAREEKMP